MATVTKAFRDNYEYWITHKLEAGEFTKQQADELKTMIRKDLTEGPDQLREGLKIIIAAGVEVPSTIDDHLERYKAWDDFFSVECAEIRFRKTGQTGSEIGINDRIRASIAADPKRMMAA